jgi:hypothetical protein
MDDNQVIRKRKEIHGHQGREDRSVRGIGLYHCSRHSERGQLLLSFCWYQNGDAFSELVRKGVVVLQGIQERRQEAVLRRN